MSPVEKEIVRRKLAVIIENLKALEPIKEMRRKEYIKDVYKRKVKLAPSAGLRNRLVHEYDLLDHSLVLESVRMAKELYSEYVKEIEDYLTGKR